MLPVWKDWDIIEALILNELRFIRQHTAVYGITPAEVDGL